MQFYCPSSTYPAFVLKVLYFISYLQSNFWYKCRAKWGKCSEGCIKNCSIVKLYKKVQITNNKKCVCTSCFTFLPQRLKSIINIFWNCSFTSQGSFGKLLSVSKNFIKPLYFSILGKQFSFSKLHFFADFRALLP